MIRVKHNVPRVCGQAYRERRHFYALRLLQPQQTDQANDRQMQRIVDVE